MFFFYLGVGGRKGIISKYRLQNPAIESTFPNIQSGTSTAKAFCIALAKQM